MARRNLTEHERSTLENGLRVAAERYRENEGELTGPSHMGLPGPQAMELAQQFARQVREAIDLADVIQGAEEIIVDDGGLMGTRECIMCGVELDGLEAPDHTLRSVCCSSKNHEDGTFEDPVCIKCCQSEGSDELRETARPEVERG